MKIHKTRICCDCKKVFYNGHCCCINKCNGHNIKTDHCAGKCLDCGWGGCICFNPFHCCCNKICGGHKFVRIREKYE